MNEDTIDITPTERSAPALPPSLMEFFNAHRGDSLLNGGGWLDGYSTGEIVEAAGEIALGEAARRSITASCRLAWIRKKRQRMINDWERLVPDELEEKLERDFQKAAERMQRLHMNDARIKRQESLAERANVIPFPAKARPPGARLKKGGTA